MKVLPAVISLISAAVLGTSNFASANHDSDWSEGLTDSDWDIKAELKPDDPAGDPGFGWQVAITDDSETVIVGSYNNGTSGCCIDLDSDFKRINDLDAFGTGSARVFTRSTNSDSSTDWSQQALLIGDDGEGGVYGGYAVEIDGDTAIVSAFDLLSCDGNNNVRVFIFVRDGNGTWSQEAILHTEYDDDSANPYFDSYGRVPRVAIKGNTAVVGRPLSSKMTTDADGYDLYSSPGSAIVYVRDGANNWSMQAFLEASDGADGDFFGADVDISGDTILVGATQENSSDNWNSVTESYIRKGKAYIFRRSGTAWNEETILYPEGAVSDDFKFGSSVALDYPTAVIGHGKPFTWSENITESDGLISAHVFEFDAGSGSWPLQKQLLHPNDGEYNERDRVWGKFGSVVAVKGNQALVGDGDIWNVFLYEKTESATGPMWDVKQNLLGFGYSDNDSNDHGNSRKLALTSDTAIMAQDDGFTGWGFNGSAIVFDNFPSLAPGPLEIAYIAHYFPPPRGSQILYLSYMYGAGRNYEVELLQKDCETPITDTNIAIEHSYPFKLNLTHNGVQQQFLFDNSTITSSSIFNAETWELLELCSHSKLVSESGAIEAEDKDVITGFIDVSNILIRPTQAVVKQITSSPTPSPTPKPIAEAASTTTAATTTTTTTTTKAALFQQPATLAPNVPPPRGVPGSPYRILLIKLDNSGNIGDTIVTQYSYDE